MSLTKARMTTMTKCYSELIKLSTFEERFRYLQLKGRVAESTFGTERWLNQVFYKSPEWLELRPKIFIRDNRCDLGIPGQDIYGRAIIHHIEPITAKDIQERNLSKLLEPENLITTCKRTHDAIHYGTELYLMVEFPDRKPNDTIPWR